jgi:hypothetical protein
MWKAPWPKQEQTWAWLWPNKNRQAGLSQLPRIFMELEVSGLLLAHGSSLDLLHFPHQVPIVYGPLHGTNSQDIEYVMAVT